MVKRPVSSSRVKKIFLASNSQGTSAGISLQQSYPSLLQNLLGPDFELHRMLISGWTLRDFVDNLSDNVVSVAPDLVVMNFGIIEGARRILSNWEKRFLSLIPGGSRVTGALHRNREKVLRVRQFVGLEARQVSLSAYSASIQDAAKIMDRNDIKFIFLKTPLFPDQGKAIGNPYINKDIELFNSALDEYPSIRFESFPGGWTMDDYQPGTVHFSVAGHRKVAEYLKSHIIGRIN